MADATEDTLFPSHAAATAPPPTPADADSDSDNGTDDGAVDYRLLASLTATSTLPRRGEKDFEPHPTRLQSSALEASRSAMFDALSHTRVHAPKQHVRGFYNPATGMTLVPRPRGTVFGKIGRSVSGGGVELWPEEALWALESGRLDVWYGGGEPEQEDEEEDSGEGQDEAAGANVKKSNKTATTAIPTTQKGIPMSLQAAYAAYLAGPGGLTTDKYIVYAGLKRAGFVVLRAPGFHETKAADPAQSVSSFPTPSAPPTPSLLSTLLAYITLTPPPPNTTQGPLIQPGLYRSYPQMYSRLQIIPVKHPYQPPSSSTPPTWTQHEQSTPFTTTYHIHRPTPTFKRTSPGTPDFCVCVLSARDTRLPTLRELDGLLAEQPFAPPPPGKAEGQRGGIGGVYRRVKHGYRSVLLGIVDEGIVSYLRFSEAGFAEERIYELATGGRGGKGGRGRGGRGRGRGRGGRGRGGA